LNTVIYSPWHNYTNLYTNKTFYPSDPFNQFHWLKKTLKDGTKNKLKNALIMHIPSILSHYNSEIDIILFYLSQILKILERNSYSFILCAHTHVDLLINSIETTNSLIIFSSPLISPQHYNNPGFRVYKIKDGKMFDYLQFTFELTHSAPHWHLEYEFSKFFLKKINVNHFLFFLFKINVCYFSIFILFFFLNHFF
jgi:sphingomyelin phosphodiesterase acid-like 3